MRIKAAGLCGIAIGSLTLGLAGGAQAGDSIGAALTGGKVNLDMRYRYENVDQDNALKNANASTLRTRLGYTTGSFYDISAMLEAENVALVGTDNYDSSVNGKIDHSRVLDPDTTEINQAYFGFAGLADTVVNLGRQRILLDNARWIGNVGWRQNEQTYDSFSLVNKSPADTQITYGYLSNANRFLGNDSPVGDAGMESHIVNVTYSGLGIGTLTGYGYLLDFDADFQAKLTGLAIPQFADAKTLGVRFTGSHAVNDSAALLYTLEYAQQSDYADSESFDADYLFAELGGTLSGITVKYGYELLGSDNGVSAVQSPLATLHAHNGWADTFAGGTPLTGLIDQSLSAGTKLADVNLALVYHDYAADDGDADYGTEWGFMASKTWEKMYTLGFKYAAYQADTLSVDTDKLWLWGEVKF